MQVGVPKEIDSGEKRVALSPDGVGKLKKLGYEVCIETGAGVGANFLDADYEAQEPRSHPTLRPSGAAPT